MKGSGGVHEDALDSEAEWNDFLLEDLLPVSPAAVRRIIYSQLVTDHLNMNVV
jgi:hypothetical protein